MLDTRALPAPVLVRRRVLPSAARASRLLEAVSEAEDLDPGNLPAAYLAAHAALAIHARAPWFHPERMALRVAGAATAGVPTRLVGFATSLGEQAHARARASQHEPVLELEARGRVSRRALAPARSLPRELRAFGRALGTDPWHYAGESRWPPELLLALAAAGVEAEEQEARARLVRLAIELVSDEPLEHALRFRLDGTHPVGGGRACVLFRVTSARGRLVARGDAVVVSALARSLALALPRAA